MNQKINILFGTETGNSEDLANRLAEKAAGQSIESEVKNLEDLNPSDLKSMAKIVVIISTWGDGEPPSPAEDFCVSLTEEQDLDLSNLSYAVLALGDTNYPEFCACGKQIDTDLSRLGAESFFERKDLDTDFDYHYDEWQDAIIQQLRATVGA